MCRDGVVLESASFVFGRFEQQLLLRLHVRLHNTFEVAHKNVELFVERFVADVAAVVALGQYFSWVMVLLALANFLRTSMSSFAMLSLSLVFEVC